MAIFNTSDSKLLNEVHKWFLQDRRETKDMRAEMREDYEFYAGHQWDHEDESFLKEAGRPIVTFNRTAPTIDSVTGSERSNRQETRYLPRNEDDGQKAEMFTEGSKWVRDNADIGDEESEAFEDAVKVGIGCTETWVDFETELDGEIRTDRISPLEVMWDYAASKRNLSDARRVYRVKMIERSEIKQLWPGKRIKWGDKNWHLTEHKSPHDSTPEFAYRQGDDVPGDKDEVPVVQVQWWERRPVWRVQNPQDGSLMVLTQEQVDEAEELFGELEKVRQTRKEYFQAFIVGETVLEKQPLHESQTIVPGFTLKFITGKRDETNGHWFGLVRMMKDPQRWSNKFFSQMLDIVNSNAKGGIFAESDAFVNQREAEENYAKPDRILWVEPGALQQGKIVERQMANFPAAIANLMQIAMEAVRSTSGVNIEMLGLAARTQSGVVEQSRIQQGLITLAILFDSLKRYRKEHGRLLMHMMNLYVPDQTMLRVVGENRFIQFQKDGSIPRFDIVVDQAPTSANQKQEVWASMQQVLPALIKAGLPIPPDIIDYLPLPESAIARIKQFYEQQAQGQQQAQQKQQQMAEADLQSTLQERQAGAFNDIASAIGQLQARQNDANANEIESVKVLADALAKLDTIGEQDNDSGTGPSGS